MTARPLAELIDSHAATLVLFARSWCTEPEDVVQEAFCALTRQRTWPTDPVAWLYTVVRNRAIDRGKSNRRRAQRETAVARPEPGFAESTIDGLDAATALAALDQLPDDQRDVIVARLWGQMTLEQIAQVMSCSVSSVHRRYEAGIAALRERLGVVCPKM